MIKIKIKHSINEAALAYSKKLGDDIYAFVDGYINKSHSQDFKKFEIPILELLYNKPNILNGAIAYSKINLEKSSLETLQKNWSAKNKIFKFDIKKRLANVKIPIYVFLDKLDQKDSAKISLFDMDSNDTQIAIQIDPEKHRDKNKLLKTNISHELRHVSQVVNDLMVRYYNELINQDNISNVDKINFSMNVKFGLGKKKHLTHSQDDYLQRDIEYKPWAAMIAERYINWLRANKIITRQTLISNKDSLHSLSVQMIKKLFEDKATLESFGKQTGKKGVKFIELHRHKKKFINELLKELEDKFKELTA